MRELFNISLKGILSLKYLVKNPTLDLARKYMKTHFSQSTTKSITTMSIPLDTLSRMLKLKEYPTYSSISLNKMKKFWLSLPKADLQCLSSTLSSLLSNAEVSIALPTLSTLSGLDNQPELMTFQSELEIEISLSRASLCLWSSKEKTMTS